MCTACIVTNETLTSKRCSNINATATIILFDDDFVRPLMMIERTRVVKIVYPVRRRTAGDLVEQTFQALMVPTQSLIACIHLTRIAFGQSQPENLIVETDSWKTEPDRRHASYPFELRIDLKTIVNIYE